MKTPLHRYDKSLERYLKENQLGPYSWTEVVYPNTTGFTMPNSVTWTNSGTTTSSSTTYVLPRPYYAHEQTGKMLEPDELRAAVLRQAQEAKWALLSEEERARLQAQHEAWRKEKGKSPLTAEQQARLGYKLWYQDP